MTISGTENSECDIFFDPEGVMLFGEDPVIPLGNNSWNTFSDTRFYCRGRTRGNERRLTINQQSLACIEYGLGIALYLEEEATQEEVLTADAGMSIELSKGNIQDSLNSII